MFVTTAACSRKLTQKADLDVTL
ncbi:hypothetical protein EYZ11_012873 [Aspergillus tanneri]|uniref:Uncharacterized protein n=1 Tax=Aspergillus tanneri TaxID=1220188 RepID=A0A4S3IZL4_9EURO|nr:hypothetical protein EYZ11_012873 [Aspergillus tanneri]